MMMIYYIPVSSRELVHVPANMYVHYSYITNYKNCISAIIQNYVNLELCKSLTFTFVRIVYVLIVTKLHINMMISMHVA